MKIGLLGGSFDPPHDGHRNISLTALKALNLDQVWWLVSPANPLKTKQPWDLEKRLQQSEKKADHPRIKITGFECQRSSYYTVDSLAYIQKRFADTQFVWIMGADNLHSIHHWVQWHKIFAMMPVLVLNRPKYRFLAHSSVAGHYYKKYRLKDENIASLAGAKLPSWGMLSLPLSPQSSTQIRERYHKGV